MKYPVGTFAIMPFLGRSRKGAWIEIGKSLEYAKNELGRSRKGAWIEIRYFLIFSPISMGRSRKGAWIEIAVGIYRYPKQQSLP